MPYPIQTERMLIEPLDERDVAAFAAYRSDPDIARWQSWETGYSVDDARELVAKQPTTAFPSEGEWLQLAVRDASTDDLLGDIALHRLDGVADTFEIGVTLAATSQGRGIATEAVRKILAYLFDEGDARRVIAACDARNAPVQRLLERVGMRHESRQIDSEWFKGDWCSMDSYAILNREHDVIRSTSLSTAGE